MVFSSLIFVFLFLPIVIILYYISKEKYRNYILLLASILFYAYGEPSFVFVMMSSIIFNYIMAIFISKNNNTGKNVKSTILLTIDIIANIGILFVYKYLAFTETVVNHVFKTQIQVSDIALPIGISFFTFQAMSYVIDVYRKTVPVQKNPLYVALYVAFFPQLVAGPIVRYSTIEQQILVRTCTTEKFADGVRRFFIGFNKKMLLANNLSNVANMAFNSNYESTSPIALWIGSVCYSLQIFYDFSGYSDMAIGLGKMFGFEFEENFNYPYISKSITEFWRRWHISLSQWFRDYVYIPLGGSRVGIPRQLLNLFIVWSLTGIWHGANYTFIIWGLGYFILLVIEKFVIKPEKFKNIVFTVLWQVITLLCVNFLWIIFNSKNIKNAIDYCLGMFGCYGNSMELTDSFAFCLNEYKFFIIAGIIFAVPISKSVSKLFDKNEMLCKVKSVITPVVYGIMFLWSVSYLILGAHNPFIYFNF